MGKVKVQSHKVGSTTYRFTSLWFHVNWSSHSRDTCFFFKTWPWKSKVKVKTQGPIMGPTCYHPIDSHPFCYMLIDSPIPEIQLFQNLTLTISKFKATKCVPLPIDSHPFLSVSIGTPIPVIHFFFYIWLWKSKISVISLWCCTATGLDNSIEFWTV